MTIYIAGNLISNYLINIKLNLSHFMITRSAIVLLMAHYIQIVFNLDVEQKENCTIKFSVFLI